MKKSLIVLAALGAFAGAASAQSSVTLFGVVDLSVNSVKNGSTTIKRMDSNQLNSNRLGFRGTEDLGGGMTAGFWLEGAMANDTGNPGGLTFTRRSTVSVSGNFGEIRLGRDYTNIFTNVASNDAYGANGMASPINLYASSTALLGVAGGAAAGSTTVRADNMVGYFTPSNLGGFYGSLQASLQEGPPTATSANKYVGVRVGYGAGPVDVAFATSKTETAGTSDYKVTNVGGSYNFGIAKLYAFWDQKKLGSVKYTTTAISTGVPLGQGELRLAYAKGAATGGTAAYNLNDSTLYGAEYIYNLSKRTALYAQMAQLKNDGAGLSVIFGGTTAAGTKSTGYGAGVRHSF